MITAEIKVNGAPLAQIYIRRLAEVPTTQLGESVYTVEYYEPERGVLTATVTHKVSDSVISLLGKAAQAIQVRSKANAENLQKPRAK